MTERSARFRTWAWGWAKSIAIALAVWFVLSTFLVKAFRISSGSMERTLLVGDFLFVNKALYGAEVPLIGGRLPGVREPRRGDIVVFRSPIEDSILVKRLIGVPGDTVGMVAGELSRNGRTVQEPYVQHLGSGDPEPPDPEMRRWQLPFFAGKDPAEYHPTSRDWGPLVVPRDSFFMLGDNRDGSRDGRFWGFVPRRNIQGSPMIVYFSYDPEHWRPLPFLTAIRWKRLFSMPR
ncbi:MAG TPA: signal peptidase I [Gemmatimonadales bacterium]|jgi:signal peptidase I